MDTRLHARIEELRQLLRWHDADFWKERRPSIIELAELRDARRNAEQEHRPDVSEWRLLRDLLEDVYGAYN
jgi:hypothetical protein